jgi:solute carrier family 8 (sodium/calcium exchanger)
MALGSSAPEILLAVLETATNLGRCPGELGASTIVGSAAFNLLVISAICVWSISPETDTIPDIEKDKDDPPRGIKKIKNMKVYAITCTSSLFAYIWLWIVLLDQQVALWEGIATFIFFFILVIFAFCADKVN